MNISRLNSEKPTTCSICSCTYISQYGEKDFGHSGNDHFSGSRQFPDYKVPVKYHKCNSCGFVFSAIFDKWQPEDFTKYIYNDEYSRADPPFLGDRAKENSKLLQTIFPHELESRKILDIGAGTGILSEELMNYGITVTNYDPFYGYDNDVTGDTFDLITSFEVIEHVTHFSQKRWMNKLASFLSKTNNAIVMVSTILLGEHDINWWYICPRNGHISIHTKKSLSILAKCSGLELVSISKGMHFLRWPDTQAEFSELEHTVPAISSR